MKAFNKVILLGNAAADPSAISSGNGKSIVTFPIAINRDWPENVGEATREVDYHRIVAWNKLAEIVEKHIKKGSKLLVSGKLINHCYEEKDGKNRYLTEIHASSIEILTWPDQSENKKADSKKVMAKA